MVIERCRCPERILRPVACIQCGCTAGRPPAAAALPALPERAALAAVPAPDAAQRGSAMRRREDNILEVRPEEWPGGDLFRGHQAEHRR